MVPKSSFKGLLKVATLLFALILSVFAFSGCSKEEFSYPIATKDFFVNDFADVITPEDEAEMQSVGEALFRKTEQQGGAQVVVVTVKNLQGKDIREYGIELSREWGIGDKDKNNGVLLLLALEEREVSVEVGSGLEGAIPDIKSDEILGNYGIAEFQKNNYSGGLVSVYKALVNEVYIEYGLEPTETLPKKEEVGEEELGLADILRLLIILAIIIGSVIFNIRLAKKRGGGGRGGRGGPPFIFFGGPGGFGGGRGGFGGGFGSGGGFSGGGGGFSGGGSSRGF